MAKNELKAVELMRAIRDRQYEQSKDKSVEELLAYFGEAAAEGNARARQTLESLPKSAGVSARTSEP